ncbi:hypothetical protein PG996_007037 [Apiospora saccharicola]|uniref:Uncharacterized protein n=1 Tax=Apiospora saccharicola TaxID=335842 RepID=A0ABR1VCF1_9PEZI
MDSPALLLTVIIPAAIVLARFNELIKPPGQASRLGGLRSPFSRRLDVNRDMICYVCAKVRTASTRRQWAMPRSRWFRFPVPGIANSGDMFPGWAPAPKPLSNSIICRHPAAGPFDSKHPRLEQTFRNVSHDDDEAQSELESILVSSPSKGQAQDPCPKTPDPCPRAGGSQTIYTTGLMPRFGHSGSTDYAIHGHAVWPPHAER